MDNITSNIMKYADPYGPVFISLYDDGEFINICFENRVLQLQEKPESTEIGIQSVRNMMKRWAENVFMASHRECFTWNYVLPKMWIFNYNPVKHGYNCLYFQNRGKEKL